MSDIKKTMATRDAYGKTLVKLGKEYSNIYVLDADLSAATKTSMFRAEYPERFINCGIAESNMMSVAAGLSTTGKKVFASTFAMFAAGRAFEQVRNSIGYPHLNVYICATHAGISVGEDGATHQCCEDIALMRTIPGMTIINPADGVEAEKAIRTVIKMEGPFYMRFGRLATPIIFDEDYEFEVGKAKTLVEGNDVTIVATGLMVAEALEAEKTLKEEGISARVINMATIKPIDRDAIVKAAKETGAIVTAEEHSIIGGLGEAVAGVVAENNPVPVLRVGVNDTFGESGPALELLKKYGLSAENIVKYVKKAVKLKK